MDPIGLPAYKYQPLRHSDSIRVLKIQPGNKSSEILTNLEEIKFKDNIHYEALSYSWASEDGDANCSQTINVSGCCVYATRNCEAAIRQFRYADSVRTLWIDAICINQENIEERTQQVGLMGDIYKNTAQTLIYLGEGQLQDVVGGGTDEKPCSEVFLEKLPEIATELDGLKRTGEEVEGTSLYSLFRDENFGGEGKRALYKGWIDVLSRRWWQRVWVVQEAAAHFGHRATVTCGSATVPYTSLLKLFRFMENEKHHHYRKMLVQRVPAAAWGHFCLLTYAQEVEEKTLEKQWFHIFELLRKGRELQATDPRDKIFGMLEVCSPMRTILPHANYNRTKEEVFSDVTIALLKTSKRLTVMYSATTTNNHDTKIQTSLPSWAIDWSANNTVKLDHLNKVEYNAAKGSELAFSTSLDMKELHVLGKQIDEISQTSAIGMKPYAIDASFDEVIPGWIATCQAWLEWKKIMPKQYTYDYRGQVIEVDPTNNFWRTLCWNYESVFNLFPCINLCSLTFEIFFKTVTSGKSIPEIKKELLADYASFWRLTNHTTPISFTKKKVVIAASCAVQAGDQIVVLSGGEMPVVVRRVGGWFSRRYRFLGPCYYHDVMNGEAFPDRESKLKYFTLV